MTGVNMAHGLYPAFRWLFYTQHLLAKQVDRNPEGEEITLSIDIRH
jgi:hypothetical protein